MAALPDEVPAGLDDDAEADGEEADDDEAVAGEEAGDEDAAGADEGPGCRWRADDDRGWDDGSTDGLAVT